MNVPYIKANEKLPQGSFFYIQVGHRFYAGDEVESVIVKSDPADQPALSRYEKDGSMSDDFYERLNRQYWFTSRSLGPRGLRAARDTRKGTTPRYATCRQRPAITEIKQLTGRFIPKLSDEVAQAKQFRRRNKVDEACERLKTCYKGLDVKISIGFHNKGS